MTIYTPITSRDDFENRIQLSDVHVAGTQEDVYLDFKAFENMGRERRRNFARNIAQFANTWGGTLVVGIDARKDAATGRDTAKKMGAVLNPGELTTWVDQALTDYLFPAAHPVPLVFTPWGLGTVVVYNVEPADTMVAVWSPRTPHEGVEYIYRTNTGKAWFTPEEAAMRTSTWAARTVRIKMDRLLRERQSLGLTTIEERRARISPCLAHRTNVPGLPRSVFSPDGHHWATVGVLNDEEFAISIFTRGGNHHRGTLLLPYQFVNFVWKDSEGKLALDLHVQIFADEQGRWLMHRPTAP